MTVTRQPYDGRLRTYHRTAAADAILATGFRDSSGSYMLVGMTLTGVFVSDVPLDENDGAHGGTVLEVVFPADLDLDDYELIEDMKPYREWCVPAAVINTHALVSELTDEQVDQLTWR